MRTKTLGQTFTKSLTKALKSGYMPMPDYRVGKFEADVNRAGLGHVSFLLMSDRGDEKVLSQVTFSIADVLFDHGYLKALYGEEKYAISCEGVYEGDWVVDKEEAKKSQKKSWLQVMPMWQYHSVQIVKLSSNKGRINYIGSTM